MEKQQIRRVELIMNYKSSTTKRENNPEKHYKSALIMQFFSLMSMLSAIYCIWKATNVILNRTEVSMNWSSFSIAMITVISFTHLLITPRNFSDFLLKKHMMSVIKNRLVVDEDSNTKLRNTIGKLTDRKMNLFFLFLPMILIIGALFEMLELNPIWNQFAYIAPLSLIMIILKLVVDYKNIKSCIVEDKK